VIGFKSGIFKIKLDQAGAFGRRSFFAETRRAECLIRARFAS
jgi:hypothetical protein